MRGTRWLLLLAILAILAGIGLTYQLRRRVLEKQAPAKPAMLPSTISGLRDEFEWSRRDQGRTIAHIRAHKVRQEQGSNQVHLEQVELRIFNKEGDHYDLVRSASAELDQATSRLYSDGEVSITLDVPVEGEPPRPLVNIKSSGVTFEAKTGKSDTNRAVAFTFESGEGRAEGASYDPTTRELHMKSDAEIDYKPRNPRAPTMKIAAGELTYKEADSVIWLNQGARMTRQNTAVHAASAIVHLSDGVIHQIDALQAEGTDEYPRRKLQYGAGELSVTYNDLGEVERISGRKQARLVSASEGSETSMNADVVDLDFETVNNESMLKRAVGNGHAVIVSKPVAAADGKPPETKVVHSDSVEVRMRPGGREIDTVATNAPGRLDFLANQPVQRPRHLDAERMTMTYGAGNYIQSFRAVSVTTETEPSAEERARKTAVSKTRSRNMSAEFDKAGQMKRMEQWDDFAYEAGDRRARAARAAMDTDSNVMTLDTAARLWDATQSTSADHIRIDEKTGDFSADGHVSSSRQPDKKSSPSGMLSEDQPLEAMADKMTSANHNHLLHYEGHVVMWQGGDRITAERADIDRDKRSLSAAGNVVTQFQEKKSEEPPAESRDRTGPAAPPAESAASPPPTFVLVKAASLVYTDNDRLAHYSGGVVLTRPGLQVKADDLRAVLRESKTAAQKKEDDEDESRLEKAFADGHVEIVQAAPDRTRTGTADHAEYYTDNERIILRGGQPQMLDSKKGYTRGAELTYFVNDDRLQVSGTPKQRATSRLRRK